MIWPKVRASRRVWGLLAGLGLITPCLFSAQVFKYQKIKPEKGHLIQTVPFEKWLERNYCGPACLAMVLNYWDETRYAMTSTDFLKVWELGNGRNQSRWMMAVVPGQSPFPFPALQNDPLTSINLATAYYRKSNFMKSREQWEKVKESLRKIPTPLYSLAMVSLREGKAEEAEAYALNALSLDGKSAYAHDVLGLAYASQGRIVQALQSLGQAVWLAPGEEFIRKHYLQVRALYIERARLENIQ